MRLLLSLLFLSLLTIFFDMDVYNTVLAMFIFITFCVLVFLNLLVNMMVRQLNIGTTTAKNITAPEKSVTAPARSAPAPARNVPAPAKNVSTPARSVPAPAKSVSAPAKSVSAPTRNVPAPVKNTSAPAKDVNAPTTSDTAPAKRSFGKPIPRSISDVMIYVRLDRGHADIPITWRSPSVVTNEGHSAGDDRPSICTGSSKVEMNEVQRRSQRPSLKKRIINVLICNTCRAA